jgi:hypothetical protein
VEKEVLRFALRKVEPITPTEVCKLLSVSDKPGRKVLIGLVQKKILCLAAGTERIRSYRLNEEVKTRIFRMD